MKTILNDIKTKNLKPLYLIYGEEGKLREDTVKKLETAALENDGIKDGFEGSFDPDEIINSANTLSLFGGKRLIVIKDSNCFGSSGYEKLMDYFKNPNPDCVMIFNEKKVDKRSKLYKAFKKSGYEFECKKPSIKEIRAFYIKEAKAKGFGLDYDALEALTANSETDLAACENEFEKLCSYCLGKSNITSDDVENIVSKKMESKVFDLIDGVVFKKPARAIEILKNMMLLKENSVGIVISLAKQFRTILQYKFLSDKMTNEEIAKHLGVHPYVITKASRQAKNFSNAQLLSALKDCRDLLENNFSGNIDIVNGIEVLILKYGTK